MASRQVHHEDDSDQAYSIVSVHPRRTTDLTDCSCRWNWKYKWQPTQLWHDWTKSRGKFESGNRLTDSATWDYKKTNDTYNAGTGCPWNNVNHHCADSLKDAPRRCRRTRETPTKREIHQQMISRKPEHCQSERFMTLEVCAPPTSS